MRHLLDAWSRRIGTYDEDYRGGHQPTEEGPPAHDLLEGGMLPDDVYEHPEWYTGFIERGFIDETMRVLNAVRGKPNAMVTIYRAAPVGVNEINRGDWVSLSLQYARQHGYSNGDDTAGDWPVYTAQVPASTVHFAGDDLMEWGYWGPDVNNARTASVRTSGNDLPLWMYEGKDHKAWLTRSADWVEVPPDVEHDSIAAYGPSLDAGWVRIGWYEADSMFLEWRGQPTEAQVRAVLRLAREFDIPEFSAEIEKDRDPQRPGYFSMPIRELRQKMLGQTTTAKLAGGLAAMYVGWWKGEVGDDEWLRTRGKGNYCLDHGFAKSVEMANLGFKVDRFMHHHYGEGCEVCGDRSPMSDPRALEINGDWIERHSKLASTEKLYRGMQVIVPEGTSISPETVLAAAQRDTRWGLGPHWSRDRSVAVSFSRPQPPHPVPGMLQGPRGTLVEDTWYKGPRGMGVSVVFEADVPLGSHDEPWSRGNVMVPSEAEVTLRPGTPVQLTSLSYFGENGWETASMRMPLTAARADWGPKEQGFYQEGYAIGYQTASTGGHLSAEVKARMGRHGDFAAGVREGLDAAKGKTAAAGSLVPIEEIRVGDSVFVTQHGTPAVNDGTWKVVKSGPYSIEHPYLSDIDLDEPQLLWFVFFTDGTASTHQYEGVSFSVRRAAKTATTDAERVVAAAIRDMHNGLIDIKHVGEIAYDAAHGDEDEAMRLIQHAMAWWGEMQQYTDRNGVPLVRSASISDYAAEVQQRRREGDPYGYQNHDCGEASASWYVVLQEHGVPVRMMMGSTDGGDDHVWLEVNGEVFDPEPGTNPGVRYEGGYEVTPTDTSWPSIAPYRKTAAAIDKRQYSPTIMWRGQTVRMYGREREQFLQAVETGSTSVMRDLILEAVVSQPVDHYEGAGTWWTEYRNQAEMFGVTFNDVPRKQMLNVGMLMGAHLPNDFRQTSKPGASVWPLGMPLVIEQLYVSLPGREIGERVWTKLPMPLMETTAASEVKTGPVPLDYPYNGQPIRFYIEDPSFEGDARAGNYFKQPGVVAFLDLFVQGSDEVFIAYMATHRGNTGKGYARKLVQAVYDRYAGPGKWINWGEVWDEHAGTLVEKFRDAYPDTNTRFKRYW